MNRHHHSAPHPFQTIASPPQPRRHASLSRFTFSQPPPSSETRWISEASYMQQILIHSIHTSCIRSQFSCVRKISSASELGTEVLIRILYSIWHCLPRYDATSLLSTIYASIEHRSRMVRSTVEKYTRVVGISCHSSAARPYCDTCEEMYVYKLEDGARIFKGAAKMLNIYGNWVNMRQLIPEICGACWRTTRICLGSILRYRHHPAK